MKALNIQRPQLFSNFLGLEIMWNNKYLTYISTTNHKVTSSIVKTANAFTNNIKNILNTKKDKIMVEDNYIRFADSPSSFYRCQVLIPEYENELILFKCSQNKHANFDFLRSEFIQEDLERSLEIRRDYLNTYEKFSIFILS